MQPLAAYTISTACHAGSGVELTPPIKVCQSFSNQAMATATVVAHRFGISHRDGRKPSWSIALLFCSTCDLATGGGALGCGGADWVMPGD